MSKLIAIIGGTGLNQWTDLSITRRETVQTPYGAPSAPLVYGQVSGVEVIFLARHGEGHKLPPHAINYRANLWALHAAGVNAVVAVAAVGGIAAWFAPGEVAIPDDVLDYTWGREHSYSDGREGSPLKHVEFSHPYTPGLREVLQSAAEHSDVRIAGAGVMAVTQGPRLESPAEIRKLQRDGADMVGMTGMPEAALAAELDLDYACLAVSVNWAAGVQGLDDIHAQIEQSIAQGMGKVRKILAQALRAAR
ncbi:MAG: S-methyl-5'-thioinosine phosphorylase [Pseudomonadota bacterium]|nr:S-methyl-5'-thioinosine phosphorylase [Pseudomonadota bacterium]